MWTALSGIAERTCRMRISISVDKHLNCSLFVGQLLGHQTVACVPVPWLARDLERQVREVFEDMRSVALDQWHNWWLATVRQRKQGLGSETGPETDMGGTEALARVNHMCQVWFDEWWGKPVGAGLALEYLVRATTESYGFTWPKTTQNWLIDVVYGAIDDKLYLTDGYAIVGTSLVASKSRFQSWLNEVLGDEATD